MNNYIVTAYQGKACTYFRVPVPENSSPWGTVEPIYTSLGYYVMRVCLESIMMRGRRRPITICDDISDLSKT